MTLAFALARALTVALALTASALFFRLRSLSRRVDKVRRVVQRMVAGNLAARAMLSGSDAAARLADAINAFAENVRQSQEAWMQRERAQKRLLASISHDLRTPIASI